MVEEDVNFGEHDFPRPAPCPKCKKHRAGLSPHIMDKEFQWKVVCNNCGLESEIKNNPIDAVEIWGKMERKMDWKQVLFILFMSLIAVFGILADSICF